MALQLGSRCIEEIHEQAIRLWICSKDRDPEINPAHGIFFALTDEPWPASTPEVVDAIQLCAVLSEAFGQPPPSDGERRLLNAKALALFVQHRRGGGTIRLFQYLTWANAAGYALAAITLWLTRMSFWIIGLAIGVWMCYGATRTATRMRREEPRPEWEVPSLATLHLAALLGLYVLCIYRLVFQ